MSKIKNLLISMLHIAVIAAIILFILFGLGKIGLLDFAEINFLVGKKSSVTLLDGTDVAKILPDNNDGLDYTITQTDINHESVEKILENLKKSDKYTHDFHYTVYSSGGTITKHIIVLQEDDVSTAYFVSADGSLSRQIIRNSEKTAVNTLSGNSLNTVVYANGLFDFEEEIGAVITHKDFFEILKDENYSFSLASSDAGTLLIVDFLSRIDDYEQNQIYALNLDYGIVIQAMCYENGNLIYSLITNSISENTDTLLTVPESFSDFYNEFSLNGISEQ